MKKLWGYFLFLFNCSCILDSTKDGIGIKNNTDSAVYVTYSTNDSFPDWPRFVYSEVYGKDIMKKPQYVVLAHSKSLPIQYIDQTELKKQGVKELSIFIVKENIVRKNSWEAISKNPMFSKKIKISIDSLKKINWTLTLSNKELDATQDNTTTQ